MTAHVPRIGLTAAVLVVSCGSQALRKPGGDASGTGGAIEAVGGAGGGGGVSSRALGGTGGGGGASSQPAWDGATVADVPAPDARTAADAPLPDAVDAGLPDAVVTTDTAPSQPPHAAEAGLGEAGSPLAAFCVGGKSKIAYGGQSFVVPVTTKIALSSRSCCMDYEARLHTLESIGEDLDVVVRPPPSLGAGTYSAEDGSQGFEATLHRSWELPYVQRLMDSRLHGWIVVEDASEDPAQSWQLGLCVSRRRALDPLAGHANLRHRRARRPGRLGRSVPHLDAQGRRAHGAGCRFARHRCARAGRGAAAQSDGRRLRGV